MNPHITKINDQKWVFSDFLLSLSTTSANQTIDSSVVAAQTAESSANSVYEQEAILSDKLNSLNINQNNDDVDNDLSHVLDTHKKSKKKRKKSAKKPKEKTTVVQFGDIEICYFCRDVGFSSVPTKGGFPLGMAWERQSVEVLNIDTYEEIKLQLQQQQPTTQPQPNISRKVIKSVDEKDKDKDIDLDSRRLMFTKIFEINQTDDAIVNSVNHEIDVIQKSRDSDKGCNCKPLKVDKLSVAKMKTELIKAGQKENNVNEMNKTQLQKKLKDVIKTSSCQLCIDVTCPCVAEEHDCNASICDCLKKISSKTGISCSNPFGKFEYDISRIHGYREKFVAKSAETISPTAISV